MKRLAWLILLLCPAVSIMAQHTFELGLYGGLAGLNSRHSYVTMCPGVHAGLRVAYGYYSPYVIGFRLGLDARLHRAGWRKTDYTDSYSTTDVENEMMQIDYTIGSFREMYTTWSVGIPLQLALRWNNWTVFAGPELVFPLARSWTETAHNAALSVYYPDYDNYVYNSWPLAASRSFEMKNAGRASRQKIQWWLAAEICYDIRFRSFGKRQSGITVGIYAEYCCLRTDIENADMQPSLIMLSDMRDGLPLERVLSSICTATRQGKPLVSSYMPFDVGIKLAYCISPYSRRSGKSMPCHCLGK